jgi:hypothetical protein
MSFSFEKKHRFLMYENGLDAGFGVPDFATGFELFRDAANRE